MLLVLYQKLEGIYENCVNCQTTYLAPRVCVLWAVSFVDTASNPIRYILPQVKARHHLKTSSIFPILSR